VRRLTISLRRHEAIRVTRVAVSHRKLVYVIVADKKLSYPRGRSRIVYIGTTKNGVNRVAQSAAYRAEKVLNLHGVEEFAVRIVACRPRQRVKTWKKLERALLLAFREIYGEVPKRNTQGKKMSWRDETEYFAKPRLLRILGDLA
jgi:predicted GIY-YIG superfamily endonuclease